MGYEFDIYQLSDGTMHGSGKIEKGIPKDIKPGHKIIMKEF